MAFSRKLLRLVTTVAIVLVIGVSIPASADTLTVCSSGCDYTSIQAAVDAAEPEDTIELGAETFYENVMIDKALTVQGAGADATIVDGVGGSYVFRVFHPHPPLTLADMTVQNARFGIIAGFGLDVHDSVVSGNYIGIGVQGALITTTTVEDNTIGVSHTGTVTIYKSVILGNSTGVSSWSADGLCSFSGDPATTAIVNSTMTGNGTAIVGRAAPLCNCIPEPCELVPTHTTVTGSTIAYNDRFAGLSSSSLQLAGSIVFSNHDSGTRCPTSSGGFNLNDDDMCGVTQPTDILNTDPLLLPLADNGGPTQTHALHPDSPAIDMGGDECEPTDQRGVARPADGDGDGVPQCDIGAFEYTPPAALVIQLIEHVESLGLHHGIEDSLLPKLDAALLVLTDVSAGNDHAAVNILGAFMNSVEAQHGKKIAATDADALIHAAQEISGLL